MDQTVGKEWHPEEVGHQMEYIVMFRYHMFTAIKLLETFEVSLRPILERIYISTPPYTAEDHADNKRGEKKTSSMRTDCWVGMPRRKRLAECSKNRYQR